MSNLPYQVTKPERMGQNGKLYFKVVEVKDHEVVLTDPSGNTDHPLVLMESDSDWDDWGDDFAMPQPLFNMLFGVEPVVGMIVALHRAK
jgi:hypothetical protein